MTRFRLTLVSALISTALPVYAQSLQDLYEAARGYDAAYMSAKAQAEANVYLSQEAKANILPTVNLTANQQSGQINVIDTNSSALANRNYVNSGATLSASQPLYRPSNLASYEQGKRQADVAREQLLVAEQDLIVRTSTAYFDVLGAQDTLTFVQAQKVAVGEQLASAKRNFEVGTATITDTREAQARYDLVIAQEIAADNDLRVKRLALDQLVGKAQVQPKPLTTTQLPDLLPNDVNAWITQAVNDHPQIRQLRISLEVAELEVAKAEAGHKPTVDLTASYAYQDASNGTVANNITSKTTTGVVGVSMTLPLFAGFFTQNRIKETLSLKEKARNDLEAAIRTVSQGVRSAFFGVSSGLGQVKALEAAESSSQLALDANKLGYQVGVRINIDVLNSQSQLFQTKRDLAKARYDVLVGGLKLRQANGTLKAEDIAPVNALLAK
jgi:outer membrane protein